MSRCDTRYISYRSAKSACFIMRQSEPSLVSCRETTPCVSLSCAGYCARFSHCFQHNATSESTTTRTTTTTTATMMGDDDGFYARNATTNVDWRMVEFMRALFFCNFLSLISHLLAFHGSWEGREKKSGSVSFAAISSFKV